MVGRWEVSGGAESERKWDRKYKGGRWGLRVLLNVFHTNLDQGSCWRLCINTDKPMGRCILYFGAYLVLQEQWLHNG